MSAGGPGRLERIDGVVVVGAGYAGLHARRAASDAGASVVVVDPSPVHGWVTRFAAVAGGTAPVTDVATPLADLRVTHRLGRVERVTDGRVHLDDGSALEASAVVVAAGSVPSSPPIPGLAAARPLRSVADALALRDELEEAEAVVVIGGGATGVQLAGAVAQARPRCTVHLVDQEHRLLLSLRPAVGRHAARVLRGRDVELHLGAGVTRISSSSVDLDDGTTLPGLPVWAGGFATEASELGAFPTTGGRIDVDEDLRVRGWTRTFAAGDVAAHLDADGALLPMSAQLAVQAGSGAGRNAAALARGAATGPVRLRQRGWVLDLGGGRGVAQIGPIPLAGPFLDLVPPLLHFAIDAKNLVEIAGVRGLRFLPDVATGPLGALVAVGRRRPPLRWAW